MRTIKKYAGGGISDDRSVNQREKDRKRKQKKIKDLEKQIEQAKGTPSAKALVQQYRALTGT